MGSHFTNADLVKESRIVDDFDFEIAFDGIRDGVDVWEFTMIPHPDAPVVWGRVEEQVRKDDLMPTWVRYYDEDGELRKEMIASEVMVMDGRKIATILTLIPHDKDGYSTEMKIAKIEFDRPIELSFFTTQNMKSVR